MTQATQVVRSAGAWSIGWRVGAWALAISLVATVLVLAAHGSLGSGILREVAGMVMARTAAALLLGVPGAALLAALVGRWPVWAQVVAFAAAGAVLGHEVERWGFVPGTTTDAWPEAALAAGLGRWLVSWQDARRARSDAVDEVELAGSDADADAGAGQPAASEPAGLAWESPLAWLVASLGLVLVPLWCGWAAIITLASFFGEPPTESDHAQAARVLWFGAGAAVVAVVVVLGLAHRVRGRGGRLRGGVTLPTLGSVVAVVLAGAAGAA